VPKDFDLLLTAKALGVTFGDEQAERPVLRASARVEQACRPAVPGSTRIEQA